MSLKVEHECPQCGGDVQLDDGDRVLACPYCGVAHLLYTPNYHRFRLPVRYPGDELQWVPYLHFKGSAFLIEDGEIKERVLHVSAPGVPSVYLPPSLGYRSQTQKLRFVKSGDEGEFVRFSLKPSEILKGALVAAGATRRSEPAYIGETASLVYLPLTRRQKSVFDAVTGQALTQAPQFEPALVEPPVGDLSFTPALCPACGGLLSVTPQAVALPCSNCDTLWESVLGRLVKRTFLSPPLVSRDKRTFLPFWTFGITGGAPAHWGELADASGQPLARRQPPLAPWRFWCPAFKVRPRVLLRLAERLSLTPPYPAARFASSGDELCELPRNHRHAVTLPSKEAEEMLPVVLASLAFTVLARPGLFALRPAVQEPQLVYLPFEKAGQDLVNRDLQLAVGISALGFGETL